MRALMSERGVSLRMLAKTVRFDPAYLSRVANNRQTPSPMLAAALDEALDTGGELVQLAQSLKKQAQPSGRRVDVRLAQHLRLRTARLRHLDDFLGGADTYPLYLSEFDATRSLINEASYTEATGRALLGVLAEQAQQAGWAAFDAGWHPTARRLWKTSMTAATDAGDTSLIANALAHLAYQKVSTARPGVDEADASCRVTGRTTPPAVQALLFERAAWAYAAAGADHEAQVDRALADARAALGRSGEEPSPDWALWVDDVELQIMTGRCWSVLHKPRRAIAALEEALAQYGDTHARDKALYSTWLAEAHLHTGDVEQAAAVLGRAMDLMTGVASVRPYQRVKAVLAQLDLHQDVPAVADLIDQAATSWFEPAIPDSAPIHPRSL
jgi:tetratricopeptide (TPR) repeat protein